LEERALSSFVLDFDNDQVGKNKSEHFEFGRSIATLCLDLSTVLPSIIMVDSVAILPTLSFFEQIDDLSNFLARALPETEKNAFLDSIRQVIESSTQTVTEQTEEGEETKQVVREPTEEDKEQTISKIVGVITGGHPGLEGPDKGES
jgi:hypothetical protein